MDLVQNLRKILIESGKIIFHGLYSHYIKPKEKPTTKRQDNSSLTMSSQSPLTTENQHSTIRMYCPDISGKIIMEKTTEDIVAHVREWAIDRVGDLNEEVYKNQKDVEILLRIFSLFEIWPAYEKPMLKYLNRQMDENRSFDSDRALRFKKKSGNDLEPWKVPLEKVVDPPSKRM